MNAFDLCAPDRASGWLHRRTVRLRDDDGYRHRGYYGYEHRDGYPGYYNRYGG